MFNLRKKLREAKDRKAKRQASEAARALSNINQAQQRQAINAKCAQLASELGRAWK